MKKKSDVWCYGRKYLWFNCCGQAECFENYEQKCVESRY